MTHRICSIPARSYESSDLDGSAARSPVDQVQDRERDGKGNHRQEQRDQRHQARLSTAPFASYGFVEEDQVPAESIEMIFAKHMRLDDAEFPKTKAWIGRILGLEKKA